MAVLTWMPTRNQGRRRRDDVEKLIEAIEKSEPTAPPQFPRPVSR